MSGPLVFVAAFLVMEAVSYATHRWVMHGVGMGWHRSHHAPPAGRLERNDLFPVCFSVLGFGAFLAAALLGSATLYWLAGGITLYGAAYLFVHEVFIHRRVSVRLPPVAYLGWLREAHRDHHVSGGEPYGMLLPVRRRPARAASTRLTRSRL
ncbi:MAG: sterol desaturase family protein [Acidimicrobiales bacterium]|nr:sterol desaturase family protein [Acidimicrobiales bacterium]